jgi:hypothetical protein
MTLNNTISRLEVVLIIVISADAGIHNPFNKSGFLLPQE